MDIRDYMRVLGRRWTSVVIGLVTVTGAALLWTMQTTPLYESETEVFISTQQTDSADNAYQGSLYSTQRVVSYAQIAGGRDVAESVISRLDLDIEVDDLRELVRAEATAKTVLLSIAVRAHDPASSQRIAGAYAAEMRRLVTELETPPGDTRPLLKATIVEQANLPTEPVVPNTVRNIALGIGLGLALGFGLAALRETLDTTIKTGEDIASATDAPVLAWLTQDPRQQGAQIVSDLGSHDPRVEAFRVLRTNLQFIDVDSASKVLAVTSSVPGEGKTTTSTNLAIALAMNGTKTLLVDADLRKPAAAHKLGLEPSVGLTTVLVGKSEVGDVTQLHSSGLHVLASGTVPPNPAEILESQRMEHVLSEVRDAYEVVIIDCPPLLPVADPAIIAAQVDGAIIVVHHGKTDREQLRQAQNRLTQVGASLAGVVVNRAPRRSGLGGSYGYGYGYGYGDAPLVEPGEQLTSIQPVADK